MAKVYVVGSTLILESATTREKLRELEKHNPKALGLYNEKGELTFKVAAREEAGTASLYGVIFNEDSKAQNSKNAILTMDIPRGVENGIAYAEDVLGEIILKVNEVEKGFPEAFEAVAAKKAAIRQAISGV